MLLVECSHLALEGAGFSHHVQGEIRFSKYRAAGRRQQRVTDRRRPNGPSPLAELSERSKNYVSQHFGAAVKWSLINDAIWRALEVRKDQTISLTEVDEVAKVASVEPNEVLALLAVLCRPASGLLRMEYLATGGGKAGQGSRDEVVKRLRAWWRVKTMPDDEWHSWAGGVVVKWRAADGEDAAE